MRNFYQAESLSKFLFILLKKDPFIIIIIIAIVFAFNREVDDTETLSLIYRPENELSSRNNSEIILNDNSSPTSLINESQEILIQVMLALILIIVLKPKQTLISTRKISQIIAPYLHQRYRITHLSTLLKNRIL